MPFDFNTLIFDRNQGDLTANNAKAYYNVSDLERIVNAAEQLRSVFIDATFIDVNTNDLQPLNTTWGPLDFVADNLNILLGKVRLLRNFLQVGPYTPDAPEDLNRPTLEKANDIERILYDVDALGNPFLAHQNCVFCTKDGEIFLLK
jgi:hypothetical protein